MASDWLIANLGTVNNNHHHYNYHNCLKKGYPGTRCFLNSLLFSSIQLNGSLRKWEKTHSMKIYSDELNGGRTSVSFAYYPQFWLPENKRPVFVKALYQLIAR